MKTNEALEQARPYYRYSDAFKLHVVGEIEKGILSIGGAQRHYGIKGNATIQKWIRRLGKNHLLGKVVRVERPDEKDRVRELEKKVRQLESALAQSHVKQLAYEALVHVAEEHYGADFKKNFGSTLSDMDLASDKKEKSK